MRVLRAVGSPALRRRLVESAKKVGARFATVIHPSVAMPRGTKIAEGTALGAGCLLGNSVRIGAHVSANMACIVSHDCVIGDFSYLAPGIRLAGGVVVGEGCYVGMGSNVLERRRVGRWSIVGAGAAVIADVAEDSTVVGVPSRTVETRPAGWHLDP